VGDLARYSEFASKADAIIGMDLLRLSDLTVDFGAGKLLFDLTEPRTYLSGADPMTQCLIVELQIQDRPVHLIVDTGSQGILLYEERLRKTVPELRTAAGVKNATMGGRVRVKQATLPDVRVGHRSREVQVTFLQSPAAGTLPGIDGIVGIGALQARRVHFDFSGKTLTWE
jgi:predicted aspartyl protease